MGRAAVFLSLAGFSAVQAPSPAAADVPSRVFLNGIPTPVYFNDGDSFRVLAGVHRGTRARLSGFNTLETFGPAHRWGTWHAKELYWIAKLATLNARRGVWRCTSELKKDTYGRILWSCPDLAEDQVRRGLAHAMSVHARPGDDRLLAAQHEAMRARRGMWAHGTPHYVMTSLHSIAEGGDDEGLVYNRLVSTFDAHSAPMRHRARYRECQTVCSTEFLVDEAQVDRALQTFLRDPNAQTLTTGMTTAEVRTAVADYGRLGFVSGIEDPGQREALTRGLASLVESGAYGPRPESPGSCALFVEFERRYGAGRAGCLR